MLTDTEGGGEEASDGEESAGMLVRLCDTSVLTNLEPVLQLNYC